MKQVGSCYSPAIEAFWKAKSYDSLFSRELDLKNSSPARLDFFGETGLVVPSCASPLILHTQAESSYGGLSPEGSSR